MDGYTAQVKVTFHADVSSLMAVVKPNGASKSPMLSATAGLLSVCHERLSPGKVDPQSRAQARLSGTTTSAVCFGYLISNVNIDTVGISKSAIATLALYKFKECPV